MQSASCMTVYRRVDCKRPGCPPDTFTMPVMERSPIAGNFFFYTFSGQDRTVVDRDKSDVGAASKRSIDCDNKWIFIIVSDIVQGVMDIQGMDGRRQTAHYMKRFTVI